MIVCRVVGPLICRFAGAAIAALVSAAAAHAFTDEAVKAAQALVQDTRDRYNQGIVSQTDVTLVEMHLLEMRYRAKQVTRTAYCEQALPVLEKFLKDARSEYAVGQVDTRDLISAQRRFYRLSASCREK